LGLRERKKPQRALRAQGFKRQGFKRQGFKRQGFKRQGFKRQGFNAKASTPRLQTSGASNVRAAEAKAPGYLPLCWRPGSHPEHQGRPTNGRSRSVTLATSVQQLLDNMKRRKFSMLRFLCRDSFSLEKATFEPAIRSDHFCGVRLQRPSSGSTVEPDAISLFQSVPAIALLEAGNWNRRVTAI